LEAKIPPCPFDSSNFFVESISWERSSDSLTPSWTIINCTLQTTNNAISSGLITNPQRSRILFDFPTHNENDNMWELDVSGGNAASVFNQVSCNGMYNGNTKPLNPSGSTYINCYSVTAESVPAWTNVGYIYWDSFMEIAAATPFNLQLAKIMNPVLLGTYSHIRIRVQQRQIDGTYYDVNDHYVWHMV
jgi:hypothetical protein